GVLGNTIFTALDVIPVVGGIRRKVASSSAEGLGGRITRQADEAAELAERGLKRGADIAPESTGIVYKRTDPKTGEEYVGKSKSPERFEARKGEHDRKLGAEHEYEILDRAPTGKPLDV